MAISTAVDASAVARVVGIKTIFKDLRVGSITFLPQRVAVVGQGASASVYPSTKQQVFSATEAATLYGFGSPIHLAVLQLLPINGDGVQSIPVTVYPLQDDASGAASVGDITATGTATAVGEWRVFINNIRSGAIVSVIGDTATIIGNKVTAAINAELNEPMIGVDGLAGVTDLTSKWEGTSANDIVIRIEGPTDAGVSFAITQPVSGAANPEVQPALDLFGNVWETMVLNCLETSDATALDAYNAFGEGRWGPLTRKPLVVFTGENETDVTTAVAIPDARKSDRVNCQLVSPGSEDLPLVIAGRQLARIVLLANNKPASDYGSQNATGLVPGADGDQWNYPQRDFAVKSGSSTVEVKDGVVNVSDTVTMFHPAGDPVPAYRYVVDIVKLQQIIFNLDLIFANDEWDGAPLIPDDQPTVNRDAKKPKTAVAAVAAMLDNLGLEALISDPETAKANTLAEIDGANPKRLNVATTVQLSGNANIISVDLNFGFFFGTSTVVA